MIFTLPPRLRILWQAQSVFAIVFLCFIITWLIQPSALRSVFLIVTIFIGIVFTAVYIPLCFKKYKITVTKGYLTVKKGVLFKTVSIMSAERISLIKTITTPLLMLLKMKITIFKTARGKLFIPAIDSEKVNNLLERITNGENRL